MKLEHETVIERSNSVYSDQYNFDVRTQNILQKSTYI